MDLADLQPDGWMHPDIEVRDSTIAGRGLVATSTIAAGVVVIRLGGRLVTTDELHRLFDAAADGEYIDTFAVDDDLHLVLPPGTTIHFGNHSCDPTTWPIGPLELATRRALHAGDELTVDYGAISDDVTFEMACTCDEPGCRRVITGADWQLPELQQQYAGHWPPGLQRRIDGLR